jgi:hypothetical protein
MIVERLERDRRAREHAADLADLPGIRGGEQQRHHVEESKGV